VTAISSALAGSGIDMTNGGTLQVRTSWTLTNFTWTRGSGTVNWNVTAANSTLPILPYNNLTITATGWTVSLAATTTIDANLLVSAGALDVTATSYAINLGGNFTNNATFTARSGEVHLNGTGAQSIGGSADANFYDLRINKASGIASLGRAETVSHNLTISAGTLDDGGFQITGAATGFLTMAAGTSLRLGGAGGNTAFPTNFTAGNITLNSASTVTYQSAGPQQVSSTPAYGNLTINKTTATGTLAGATTVNGTLTLSTGTLADGGFTLTAKGNVANSATHSGAGKILLSGGSAQHQLSGAGTYQNLELNDANGALLTGSPTVNGTLTLTAGTLADGGNTLSAKGNVANSATHSGAGKIVLNGTSQQTLSGAGTYGNLELNNAAGATLGASASPTVNGTLTFTSGKLTTGSDTLTMGASGSIGGTPDGSRHVVGNLGKSFSAAGSFLYPVGDGTSYTPVTLAFSASGFSAGSLTVSSANGAGVVNTPDHPNTTSGTDGLNKDKSVNRYWTVKRPAASTIAGSYTALFQYPSADLDAGTTAASLVFQQGSGCSGSGAGRTCSSGWTQRSTTSNNCSSGNPTSTQACATNPGLPASATESDFALGELGPTGFAREKQFIYTRERY